MKDCKSNLIYEDIDGIKNASPKLQQNISKKYAEETCDNQSYQQAFFYDTDVGNSITQNVDYLIDEDDSDDSDEDEGVCTFNIYKSIQTRHSKQTIFKILKAHYCITYFVLKVIKIYYWMC